MSAETKLLAALASNCDAAFEQVVYAYQGRLYAFALRLTGNPQDAEEIAQDAFVRAYQALATYDSQRIRTLALRAWLYQIALNVFRNRVRGRRLPLVPLEGEGDEPVIEIEDDARARPEEQLLRSEGREELGALVLRLAPRLRVAVVLRHVEGMSYCEIATLLDEPVGTVKSNVHRGTLQLRRALAEQREEVLA